MKGDMSAFASHLLSFSKRTRMILATVASTAAFFASISIPFVYFPLVVVVFGIAIYILTWYGLKDYIDGKEWYMLFVTPVVWSVVWYLFYFLTPIRWISRLNALLAYIVMYYAILSTNNILNVAKSQSLQLLRVARTVNQIIHVTMTYLFILVLFAFEFHWALNSFFTFCYFSFIYTQFYWSHFVGGGGSRGDVSYQSPSVLTSVIITTLATFMFFLPIYTLAQRVAILAASTYVLSGLLVVHIQDKVFPTYYREFVIALLIIIPALLLSIQWGV